MRLLIVSGFLLVASFVCQALLPAYVVTDFHFRENRWVPHVHLNRAVFCILLAAAVLLFLFSRFEVVFRPR
jgi:hypothetical protein